MKPDNLDVGFSEYAMTTMIKSGSQISDNSQNEKSNNMMDFSLSVADRSVIENNEFKLTTRNAQNKFNSTYKKMKKSD